MGLLRLMCNLLTLCTTTVFIVLPKFVERIFSSIIDSRAENTLLDPQRHLSDRTSAGALHASWIPGRSHTAGSDAAAPVS